VTNCKVKDKVVRFEVFTAVTMKNGVFWATRRNNPEDTILQGQGYLTTDGHSASLSWYQATIWDARPIYFFPAHGICFQTA
jgi:hypothetical protein